MSNLIMVNTPLNLKGNMQAQHIPLDVKAQPQKKSKAQYGFLKMTGALVGGVIVFFAYSQFIQNPNNQSSDLKASISDFSYTSDLNTQQIDTPIENTEIEDIINSVVLEENNINEDISSIPVSKEIIRVSAQIDNPMLVAGEPLLVISSEVTPNTSVTFIVEKDNVFAEFSGQSNDKGIAAVSVPGQVFTESGTYNISVKSSNNYVGQGIINLSVQAGEKPSAEFSSVIVDQQILSFKERTDVVVVLKDKYDNPISGHKVQILTTPTNIKGKNILKTNSQGKASFVVENNDGLNMQISILDTTSGVMMPHIINIESESSNSIQTNLIQSFLGIPTAFAQSQPNSFIIKSILNDIQPNTPVTFDVEVIDSEDQTVEDYTGTVIFESSDTQAELPNDTTFQSGDNGQVTINGKLTFLTPGKQTLTVRDSSDSTIFGTIKVTVLGDTGNTSTGGDVSILIPPSGETTTSQKVDILGTSDINAEVTLFDNNINQGSIKADFQGVFLFEEVLLSDGKHTIHVTSNGSRSEDVVIIIDTDSPDIESITVTPEIVAAGNPIDIEIESEKDLSKIEVTIPKDGRTFELIKNPLVNGVYTGAVNAPETPGMYFLDLKLFDASGNATEYPQQAQITVTGESVVTPNPGEVIPSQPNIPVINPTPVPTNTDTGPREVALVTFLIAFGIALYWDMKKMEEEF